VRTALNIWRCGVKLAAHSCMQQI